MIKVRNNVITGEWVQWMEVKEVSQQEEELVKQCNEEEMAEQRNQLDFNKSIVGILGKKKGKTHLKRRQQIQKSPRQGNMEFESEVVEQPNVEVVIERDSMDKVQLQKQPTGRICFRIKCGQLGRSWNEGIGWSW